MRKRTLFFIIATLALIFLFNTVIDSTRDFRLFALSPKILKYRRTLQKHAREQRLDWLLVSALIVQESGFDESAVSSVGAQGLAQLMPATAKELGVRDAFDAAQNIAGATKYLRQLYDAFSGTPHEPRIRLALASYNGGKGRVRDAQRIVRYQQGEPLEWEEVSRALSRLTAADAQLHRGVWPVKGKPPHGYFLGADETRDYVEKVMRYYERLRFYRGLLFFL
ncbi:hypothetical protein C6495_18215 [Candidatus Poribacteria bacterium]|nr:MAG: hypothetical protein C6495_18215 [Candidatus Poribacteria bacterium]